MTGIRFHNTFSIGLAMCMLLASCSSPEAQRKERVEQMSKFAASAVKHMYDRNPETVQESMTLLTRDELRRDVCEKLQQQHLLPETDISVLKIKSEAESKNSSNEVVIDSVKPVGDTDKPEVRFQINGKDNLTINKKPAGTKPIDVFATVLLTPQMDGFPRITELTVPGTATKSAEADAVQPKKKRKRRG